MRMVEALAAINPIGNECTLFDRGCPDINQLIGLLVIVYALITALLLSVGLVAFAKWARYRKGLSAVADRQDEGAGS